MIEVEHLGKIWRSGANQVRALDGVVLTIAAGETVVLLGPSGSGKATLLDILGGLDHATSGTVRFRGQDITALRTWPKSSVASRTRISSSVIPATVSPIAPE